MDASKRSRSSRTIAQRSVRERFADIPLIDRVAYLYIALSGVVLLVIVWPLGLYADDYWNLHDATTRSIGGYFRHHLMHTNSRYTYALFHRALMALFYDPGDPFGETYIKAVHVISVLMHVTSCALVFRILRQLRVNYVAVIGILPLLLFPVFGKQAVLWIAASMAHVLGLMSFLFAALATIKHRPRGLLIGILAALGSSEFVLLPSGMLVGIYAWNEWRRHEDLERVDRVKRTISRCSPLLIPFVVYAVVVLSSRGIHRRIDVLERYNRVQLWTAPLTCLTHYLGHYIPELQPMETFAKHPVLIVLVFAVLIGLALSRREAFRTGTCLVFFLASAFPLAAVGYYTGGSRLRYIMGILFYISIAQAVSAVIERWKPKQPSLLLWGGLLGVFVLALSAYRIHQFGKFSDDGRRAYACIKDITLHMYDETQGDAPKRIEWCGESNQVGEFPVINNWSLPRSLALKYGSKKPVRIERHEKCGRKRIPEYKTAACQKPLWYKINL